VEHRGETVDIEELDLKKKKKNWLVLLRLYQGLYDVCRMYITRTSTVPSHSYH